MEQTIPGSQNEHFFELLHPAGARAPPPPPPPPRRPAEANSTSPPPADSAADESPSTDQPSLPSITPSYDFQLTHPPTSDESSARPEEALPSVQHVPPFVYPSANSDQDSSVETARGFVHGRLSDPKIAIDCITMDAIDNTMKQYTDNILRVLDSVNGRLEQLETTVQGLDQTVAEMKDAKRDEQYQSNLRLTKLELLMEEVRRGVQCLHENQRLDEAKSQLSKLHLDEPQYPGEVVLHTNEEGWQQSKTAKENLSHVALSESSSQLPQLLPPQYPPPVHSHYPLSLPPPQMQTFATSQSMLPLPPPVNPPLSHQQAGPPTVQHIPPPQQQSNQQTPQPPPQMSLQFPAYHSQSVPQPPIPNLYNLPTDTAPYMQTSSHQPPSPVTQTTYLSEPSPYVAGMQIPHEALHSGQQRNPGGSQHTYDSGIGRMGSSIPQSYMQPPLPKPGLPVPSMYEAQSSGGYGGAQYRPAHPVPSAPSGGSAGYPRLPTAQPVQHSLPAVNPISRNPMRSPVDDVIDKVCNMGFSRERTREVVRQLTENGQPVDMNAVLDRVTNSGDTSQPPRGWFNRG